MALLILGIAEQDAMRRSALMDEALTTARDTGEDWLVCFGLWLKSWFLSRTEAQLVLEQARRLLRRLGDGMATGLGCM